MEMGLIGGTGLIIAAVVVWRVTVAAAEGRLPRNGGVGIRTPATQASDAAWLAGHRAALRPSRVLALVCGSLGLALAIAGVTSGQTPSPLVITLFTLGHLALIAGTLLVARAANRAARDL